MSLFNKNDIVVASREATLQSIEQIKNISKEVQLSELARKDFDERIGYIQTNAEKLSLVLSVIGIMKAGKSTLINSIVGTEVLPSRGTAMTVIPTYIKHEDNCNNIKYSFKHAKQFNQVLTELKKTGYQHELENSALSRRLKDDLFLLDGELEDLTKIHEQLEIINDLCRISLLRTEHHNFIIDTFKQDDDFPTLVTTFKSIKDLNTTSDLSNFVIVDTPGSNEAKLPQLKEVVNKQIARSSALLLVLNYTDLASDADEKMRARIISEASAYKDRLIVAVNRFDAKDQKSMKKNETIRYVQEELLEDIPLDDSYIFPVSARNALLGRQSLDWLDNIGKFDLGSLQGWQRDFLDNTTSGEWDEEDDDDLETIKDINETKRHARKLLKSSRIGDFISTAISRAYQNAGPDTLISALSGLRRLIEESLSLTLETDIDSAARSISELEGRIKALEHALKSLNDLSYTTNKKLLDWYENISLITNKCLKEKVEQLKDESSEVDQTNEYQFGSSHKQKAQESVDAAKEKLFAKIKSRFGAIELDIQNKIKDGVIDISTCIENDVNAFSSVFEHEVLSGFKIKPKALDFKVEFDSEALNTGDFIKASTHTKRKPREVFGFKLSWLPEFTYAEYTTTNYSVDVLELIKSITKTIDTSLNTQMDDFKTQLQSIVSEFEKDITLLCDTIRHSSEEAMKTANDSTEEQLKKKEFCHYQLEQLDKIDEYAVEVSNGLNDIRGAV